MENIYENSSYVAAVPKPQSPLEIVTLYLRTFFDILWVTLQSVPIFLQSFVHLFIDRPKKQIRGQLALVTGAGNGIGRQIALRLAREGCHVAVADIDRVAAEQTAADVRKLLVKAAAFQVDVADMASVKRLKEDIVREMDQTVDILINNAALMPLVSLEEGTDDEIERIIRVNVTSHFFVSIFPIFNLISFQK